MCVYTYTDIYIYTYTYTDVYTYIVAAPKVWAISTIEPLGTGMDESGGGP